MKITKIDGATLREMFETGAKNLEIHKKDVDELNVFPVPDGDTGTNMSMTFSNSIRELEKEEKDDVGSIAKTASNGALIGARGNSGVILSQILRGVASALKGKKAIYLSDAAKAIISARDTAYKAVMKPTEGTILTVIREMAEFTEAHQDEYEDLLPFLKDVLKQGEDALRRTPEMLPVLKEAGVVDSGGQGLVYIAEGAVKALSGEKLDQEVSLKLSDRERFVDDSNMKPEDLTYGYCTEFIVKHAQDADENELREYLSSIGDCVLVIKDDDLIKVHVHTDHPGKAFEKGLSLGALTRMKVDNMREMLGVPDEEDRAAADAEPVPYGFVAVSPGDGLTAIFKDLGVTRVISGGQTMNPSTEDFMSEINKMNADQIFLFPNNGNIIMAANQAEEIADKPVHVIPTKNIPQCVSALLSFNPDSDWQTNLDAMQEATENVKAGEVTYAVRDTKINGLDIEKGDIMGIADGDIKTTGKDIDTVTDELIAGMIDEDSGLISVYYGEDVSEDDAKAFAAKLEDKYEDCDVELDRGGQPLYYYIVSVE